MKDEIIKKINAFVVFSFHKMCVISIQSERLEIVYVRKSRRIEMGTDYYSELDGFDSDFCLPWKFGYA